METTYTFIESPIGDVRVAWSDDGLVEVSLGSQVREIPVDARWRFDAGLRCDATEQLRAYFARRLWRFDLPLVLNGTEFQCRVWRALAEIPYGQTVSYGELAAAVGAPRAVRAVGSANGKNPMAIVLPCHRVIGSDGRLRGYAGGLDIKAALLDLERGVTPLLATQ